MPSSSSSFGRTSVLLLSSLLLSLLLNQRCVWAFPVAPRGPTTTTFTTPHAATVASSFRLFSTTTAVAAAQLCLEQDAPPEEDVATVVLIGKQELVKQMAATYISDATVIQAMLDHSGDHCATFLPNTKVALCVLPEQVTRNNHPLSVHKITEFVQTHAASGKSTLIVVGGVTHSAPIAAAVARAFPLYSRQTTSATQADNNTDNNNKKPAKIYLSCLDTNLNSVSNPTTDARVAQGVRLAAQLIDTTPEELTTLAFAQHAKAIADAHPDCVTFSEIVGPHLEQQGYGGLFGIGKAADCPPRLVTLEYTPPNNAAVKTVAWVGKGIVYDTGGLSLKSKTGMPGMKHDCGGACGMLGAFQTAVELQVPDTKLVLLLCLAENAIGPRAVRNDDILTLYSGKTVEINNADAEGRVVLGDGVAHATKHYNCQLVVDMATLTGAQLIATGKKHAGILANTVELEQRAVQAGLLSGDLVFPLLYAPELLKQEFKSEVADMKNSVKDRGNAQSSCAGHFIESHLDEKYQGEWLHIDMAGPASNGERGTGYGVGLLLALIGAPGFARR